MSDFVWFMMIAVLFAVLGFIFIWLGWQIWKKQRMDLIISYHCDRVSEENRQAYCTLFGLGIIVMGKGFIISGIFTASALSVPFYVPMIIGLVTGAALLISAIIKYNR